MLHPVFNPLLARRAIACSSKHPNWALSHKRMQEEGLESLLIWPWEEVEVLQQRSPAQLSCLGEIASVWLESSVV